jgi:cation-transporting ATPase E
VILAVGEPQDAVFGIILVTNALIGIAQELRAKRTLDRLAVLSAPTTWSTCGPATSSWRTGCC